MLWVVMRCFYTIAERVPQERAMETVITIHIERLPEGLYLARSDDVQGLVAQGRTVTETLEIARDVARKLIDAQQERRTSRSLPPVHEAFDYPLIVGT
jgi:predicted RNase H-like HicB family nuclease